MAAQIPERSETISTLRVGNKISLKPQLLAKLVSLSPTLILSPPIVASRCILLPKPAFRGNAKHGLWYTTIYITSTLKSRQPHFRSYLNK